MVIRKLSLADWFIRFQLLHLKKHHFYTPLFSNVNINSLVDYYGGIKNVPLSALVIKASALLHEIVPESHRAIIPSLWGPRQLDFAQAKVNVPVLLNINNERYLSGLVLEDLQNKSPEEIQKELRSKVEFDKKRFPICNFISRRKNNFFNRQILKLIYLIAYRSPRLFLKKAGGISVSITSSKRLNNHDLVGVPMGPTALSIGVAGTNVSGGDYYLKVGAGYDHTALLAHDALSYLGEFSNILNGKNKNLFSTLIGPSHKNESKPLPKSKEAFGRVASEGKVDDSAKPSPHSEGFSPSI